MPCYSGFTECFRNKDDPCDCCQQRLTEISQEQIKRYTIDCVQKIIDEIAETKVERKVTERYAVFIREIKQLTKHSHEIIELREENIKLNKKIVELLEQKDK